MSNDIKKRGLGRGLDALFRDVKKEEQAYETKSAVPVTKPAAEIAPPVKRADEIVAASQKIQAQPVSTAAPVPAPAATVTTGGVRKVAIQYLSPGTWQPRRFFDDAALQNLADSIRQHGILQPLLVRQKSPTSFEIIAGERRWRAAQLAAQHDVPVIVREMTDMEAAEFALIENLQREDLTAIEEAEAYQRLIEEFNHTQDNLAKHLGKSRSHVTNTLRLLTLPASVRAKVHNGQLSAGHARALVGQPKAEQLAETIIKRGLSVRQVEKLVSAVAAGKKNVPGKKLFVEKDVDILALEQKITAQLGLRVAISHGEKGGQITIDYKSLDQLDDVIKRLSTTPKNGA